MTHPRGSRYRNASARLPACGAVAQLGERLNGIQEVEGSTPFGSTLPFAGLGDLRAASEADRSRFVADDHDLSRRLLLVDGPARAIHCADAIRQASRALGLDVRAGLHTGECETRGVQRGEGRGVKRRSNRRSTAPRPSSWAFDVKGYVSRSGSAEKSSPLLWVLPLVQQASNLFFPRVKRPVRMSSPAGKRRHHGYFDSDDHRCGRPLLAECCTLVRTGGGTFVAMQS